MASQFNRFKDTLSELFMLDQAELDFGIYRIMNQKRTEIDSYLDVDLVRQVKEVLAANAGGKRESLLKDIAEATKNAESLGVDAASLPKIQALKAELNELGGAEVLENDVYDHLATFFRRYYDGGDFISLRRYKRDVYAIPYEGEEVKLHWANADQYYIKTSEYFRNYSFKLESSEKRVSFVLIEASTELNNNKSQGDKERRFAIFKDNPVEVDGSELRINFTYEPAEEKVKQTDLMAAAYEVVKPLVPIELTELFSIRATDKNKNRTLLEKHFTDFVAKNTFDYFIHKDLRGFLTRELDFYIKNEIFYIDDINTKQESEFLKHLSVIKAVKAVGGKIIDFLSSLEDFQKKLWLKKKFVVETNYCITLDRVPVELYSKVASNEAQRAEWVRLFAIDEIKSSVGDLLSSGAVGYSVPLSVEFLKSNPYLVLDTAFFDDHFKQRLLSSIDDFDAQLDGTLINSENFQALNLLQEKYVEQVKCIYIDPPYNSKFSEIAYKNSFKHSSWLSLMDNRVTRSKTLMTSDGILVAAIDENEKERLTMLLDGIFIDKDVISTTVIHNPRGIQGKNFSYNNEFAIFCLPPVKCLKEIKRKKEDWSYSNLRNWGGESLRTDAKNCFYPLIIKDNKVIGKGEVPDDNYHPQSQTETNGNEFLVWPIDVHGVERKWRYAYQTVDTIMPTLKVRVNKDRLEVELPENKDKVKTTWIDKRYDASIYGTQILSSMFEKKEFDFPKSVFVVQDSIDVTSENNSIILDYFAGSGTTGHAVINLNREDNGKRKYMLVEMGTYFDSVTKPRIQKVIYSKDWKDGKPVSRVGSSHCFKYVRLEQYEDTLNNLIVKNRAEQQDVFDTSDSFRESFLLGYMLDTETKDSLLSADWFINPFAVSLKITKQNETQQKNIDIIETFNYLIGLNIESIAYPKVGICTVTGTTRLGERSLIIWRDCTKIDNKTLNTFFIKSAYSTRDNEFDRIYINGDNNLENLRTDEDHWKVVLTEEEFAKRMFETK